jgi:ankyrin repeat protein
VSKLLEKGANTEAADVVTHSLLHNCATRFRSINRWLDTRKLLLQEGQTPLHYAVISGHKEIVALLLEKGANIEAIDIRVMSPAKNNS